MLSYSQTAWQLDFGLHRDWALIRRDPRGTTLSQAHVRARAARRRLGMGQCLQTLKFRGPTEIEGEIKSHQFESRQQVLLETT